MFQNINLFPANGMERKTFDYCGVSRNSVTYFGHQDRPQMCHQNSGARKMVSLLVINEPVSENVHINVANDEGQRNFQGHAVFLAN
jgi:hypothetical protein